MNKLNFQEVRTYYNISSKEIAELAKVRLIHEYRMEIGRPVSTIFAQRVLYAFSVLAQRFFALDDVEVTLIEDCVTEELATVKVRLCK